MVTLSLMDFSVFTRLALPLERGIEFGGGYGENRKQSKCLYLSSYILVTFGTE